VESGTATKAVKSAPAHQAENREEREAEGQSHSSQVFSVTRRSAEKSRMHKTSLALIGVLIVLATLCVAIP